MLNRPWNPIKYFFNITVFLLLAININAKVPSLGNVMPDASLINQFNQLPASQKADLMTKATESKNLSTPQPPLLPPVDMSPKTEPANAISPVEAQYNDSIKSNEFSPKIGGAASVSVNESVIARQYGYTFFTTNNGTPSAYVNTPTNPDYILGPGDALLIRVWGKIEEQFSVTIDNNGQIFLPKLGVINVAGVSYGRVGSVIKSELSKYYVNFQVSVTIGSMRSIKVFVLGEVSRPGAYDVPAKGTLMTALYSSGGPLKTGSLRKIQLIRNKRVVRTIDLYEYLMSGNQTQDPMLQNFDTVFIPLIGDTVKVSGIVNRPGIYELDSTSTVYDAVQTLGGGVGATFYAKRVQIDRIVKGSKRIMLDLTSSDLSKFVSELKSEKVRNGDVITVLPIFDRRYNQVSIQGNVLRPGDYEFESGMTIGDLIKKSEGLLKDTYFTRLEILRLKSPTEREIIPVDYTHPASAKIKLSEFDIVKVSSVQMVEGEKSVNVSGAAENAGEFRLLSGMKLLDLVFMAKPSRSADWNYAELVRQLPNGGQAVIPVNLEALKNNPAASTNFLLIDKDQLFLRVDVQKEAIRMVSITGQVRFPGRYIMKQGDRLTDVISRAGGLTPSAYLPGLIFKRDSVAARQANAQKYIANEESRRLFFDPVRIKSLESQQYRELYTSTIQGGQLAGTGTFDPSRIMVDIESIDTIAPEYNLELRDLDEVIIPETPTSVQISGGIQNPGAQVYIKGQNAGFYIQRCGGFSRFAMQSDIFVVRASGRVVRDGGIGIPVFPGDSIYVQEEIKTPFDWVGGIFEFSKFVVNIVTTVALVNTLQ